MQITLIGADIEENLGVGMVAAVAAAAGHAVRILAFDGPGDAEAVAGRALRPEPDLVGMSIQFQHRGAEFLGLARRLRELGFTGHLCCGGQFPSMAWREVLAGGHGVDSVVLHEGERTFVELLDALAEGRRLVEVPGLAVPGDDGAPVRTPGRGLVDDLDALPFPARYRSHTLQYGIPFIPIMGGRGCWGRCAFCSITSCHRDAHAAGTGGARLRHRSPEGLADEMATLSRAAGGEAIFCFHDDNFLMPKPRASLSRVRRIRAALDERGVGRAALVGKCRPDSTTPQLLRDVAELGVVRLYVGVENASQAGADHLGRRTQAAKVTEALASCRKADIFACYNLLIFEPDATVDDVRENVAFIRDHAVHPINFCRAEAYYGTPLMRSLEAQGKLGGSYLGFTYRIEDEATELVFRVCAAAFRQRNFDPQGVANRYMGLGYAARIIDFFYGHDDRGGPVARLRRRADELTRAISLETAAFIDEAIAVVERAGGHDHDRLARQTALLGLRIAEADGRRHAELDEAFAEMNAFARRARRPRALQRLLAPFVPLAPLAPGVVLVGSLLAGCGNSGCSGHQQVVDPPPPDQNVPYDSVPPPDPVPENIQPLDPPPPPYVPKPPDVQPLDPPPPPPDPLPAPPDPLPPDPPPPPTVLDPAPAPRGQTSELIRPDPVTAGFRDTAAGVLDTGIPLWRPPRVSLAAHREVADDGREVITVSVESVDQTLSLRWEGDGTILGRGRSVRWIPDSEAAQLRVAVRTPGGVAVTALRAVSVGA